MGKYWGEYKPAEKKSKRKTSYKAKPKTQSRLQIDKECYIAKFAGTPCEGGLEEHHILFGNPNRKYSEEDGLKCWSCSAHHRGDVSVHKDAVIDRALKWNAQLIYESELGTREDFRKRYGKSYLHEEE